MKMFLLMVVVFFSTSTFFTQERKIEKFVYANFREGKLDIALQELENLRSKYEEKSFFNYWKSFILMEKLNRLKDSDWDESNRDLCFSLIEKSKGLLEKASTILTSDELNIDQEDFNVLFPGCSISPLNGEKKFTNCVEPLRKKFQLLGEGLNDLTLNLNLVDIIQLRIDEKNDLENFLKLIRPRITSNYYAHPLRGEITKDLFLKVAWARNEVEFQKMKDDKSEENWLNYLRRNTDEEHQSIVPKLENLVNNNHLLRIQNAYDLLKNNVLALPSFMLELEKELNLLETNQNKYFSDLYGEIKFSKSFHDLRKLNYYKVINQGRVQQPENISRQKKIEEEFEYNEDLIVDGFENNSNNWNEVDNQYAYSKVSNGKLIFENKFGGSYTLLSNITIPSNNNRFFISINTKWVSGIDNNSINLVWGAKGGESTYYSFGISANGSYRHMRSENGVLTDIITWNNSEFINRLGNNIISVRREDDKITFYINYFKVNEASFSEFFGNNIGVTIHGKQKIEFDDLKLKINTFEELDMIGANASEEEMSAISSSEEETDTETINEPEEKQDGPGLGAVDIDGNKYKTVYIGNQEWFAENLRVSKYNDGTKLPQITSKISNNKIFSDWGDKTKECWCYYGDNPSNNLKFGKLYTAYVVNTSKNICPNGWHVSTDKEWWQMINYLGGNKVAGNKLKSKTGWLEDYGTNSFGFNALPGGCRINDSFKEKETTGYWWTEPDDVEGWHNNIEIYWYEDATYDFRLGYDVQNIKSDGRQSSIGLSIRCVKD